MPAAWARSAAVYSTCTSFSASAMVAGVTSGPTAGPVPNAGGVPGGGSWTGSPVNARAPSAVAMPTRPSTERLRKRRRMLDMDGILPDHES